MGSAPQTVRALLVEDEDQHARLIARLLSSSADWLRLERTRSVAEALEQLETRVYDVALLDLGLPDSDRSETLRRITEPHPDLPVIVLTSLADVDFATAAVQQGAQDYLVKSELAGDLLARAIRYAIERQRVARALERSNQELRRFAHVLAHEVRNPLNTLSLSLQVVRAHVRPEGTDFLDRVERALRDMDELVTKLLRFAATEQAASAAETSWQDLELDEVLEQACESQRAEIVRTGAEITHDPLPRVRGDAFELRHLFQNLLGNALKYRGAVSPRIHVSALERDGGWQLSVRDNGIGIAPEDRERIFDMFSRVGSERPGTGIGLAFCQRIVERHGGRIWVESEPGAGSTFHFTLGVGARTGDRPATGEDQPTADPPALDLPATGDPHAPDRAPRPADRAADLR